MAASSSNRRLEGRVIIVTGGDSGYGAGIVKRFAEEGAFVALSDINVGAGQEIAATNPTAIKFYKHDVSKQSDWQDLVHRVVSNHGRVDCLVNNAGTTYANKPTLEVTEEDFDRCFNVNVKGVFFGTQIVLKQFVKQGSGGSIINIASVGATRPRPGLVWYNSSKGAIWNATKGLAAEFGPYKIRVNSVCPLLGGTGLFQAFSGVPDTPENRSKFLSNVPLGRLCEASDVANACLYLASDESAFVTGINMEVDGGRAI